MSKIETWSQSHNVIINVHVHELCVVLSKLSLSVQFINGRPRSLKVKVKMKGEVGKTKTESKKIIHLL